MARASDQWTEEQKAARAARLARGRATAQANRERNKLLGIKKPLTPKQRGRMKKMAAARDARNAAVNLAVTSAMSPVALKTRDYKRNARTAGRPSMTKQEAAANARAHKPVKLSSETPLAAAVTNAPVAAMSVDDRLAYYRLKLENRFALFRPYDKQREFFAMGATKRERLLRAGNQVGKTTAGAYEIACHMTGRYPEWWTGRRFTYPPLVWIGGLSGVAVRDAMQAKLLGTPGDPSALGMGMIPKELLVGTPNASRSAPNGIDSFLVKHISGGNARGVFKTYEQGAGFWQGPTVDVVSLDEEPPADVLGEALARLTGEGILFITLSPLLGRSLVVMRFIGDLSGAEHQDRGSVRMTLADAEHFTEEQKARRRASYSEHERSAREFGDPTMGEGSVFSTPEADLRLNLSLGSVPNEWRKIWGLDFGSNHPFAAVLLAFDLENDVDYVLHCIKMRTNPNEPSILGHCDAIKRVCALAPVAWPHDGAVSRNGEALKDIYKSHGLKMLESHALNPSGNHYTKPGLDAMDARMQERRFKVRNSPENEAYFEEYRAYHRKADNEGRSHIVRQFDDVMSATRIGYIMKPRARPVALGGPLPAERRRPPIREFDLFSGAPIEPRAT